MSWSIYKTGTAEELSKALKDYGNSITGQSKEEFDEAAPHIEALVNQNFAVDGSGYAEKYLDLSACGSGYSKDGNQMERSCIISIKSATKPAGTTK